jgi:hypothetical protein
MTPAKARALTIQTLVGKEMSLLLNMVSRFVITFPPRSKHLLISWLQTLFAVILEPKKIKSVAVSTLFGFGITVVLALENKFGSIPSFLTFWKSFTISGINIPVNVF